MGREKKCIDSKGNVIECELNKFPGRQMVFFYLYSFEFIGIFFFASDSTIAAQRHRIAAVVYFINFIDDIVVDDSVFVWAWAPFVSCT